MPVHGSRQPEPENAGDGSQSQAGGRYAGTGLRFNSQLGPGKSGKYCRLGLAQQQYMEQLFHALQLSARAYHRIIRLARTLADLTEKILSNRFI